jgi:hypothetical protein
MPHRPSVPSTVVRQIPSKAAETDEEEEESVSDRLERVRLRQLERIRAKGCDAEELLRPLAELPPSVAVGLSQPASSSSSKTSGTKYGLHASFAKETEHVPTNALM